MRSTLVFILALIAISNTIAIQSTLRKAMTKSAEYKAKVDKIKQSKVGSVIMSLASLHQEENGFDALFNALDDLQADLAATSLEENQNFAEASSEWQSNVASFQNDANEAQEQADSDNSLLNSNLYPSRDNLVSVIGFNKDQIEQLSENLEALNENRAEESDAYNQESADYDEAIQAVGDAIPVLQRLQSEPSFIQVNGEQFAQVTLKMKKALSKQKYGKLYTSFIQNLEKMTQFVNQEGLDHVISLLEGLLERLQSGKQNLDNDEAADAAEFAATSALLNGLLADFQEALQNANDQLNVLEANIAATEEDRDTQVSANAEALEDLAEVNAAYKQRTADHDALLNEVGRENELINEAVQVLNQGGIARSASQ